MLILQKPSNLWTAKAATNNRSLVGADPGCGAHFKKKKKIYIYKIRYKEYLLRTRKEITTNYKLKKADKYHKTSQNLEK
jgi:hypothetical protein